MIFISSPELYVIKFSHFQLLLQNHQTYNNCFSRGHEEVLYLFEVIRNPRWLLWPLICRDMFNFSKATAYEVTRLARYCPLIVLQKCSYFAEWFDIQHGSPGLWLAETFFTFFFQNYIILGCQACRKCSSRGTEEEFKIFWGFWHPRQLFLLD